MHMLKLFPVCVAALSRRCCAAGAGGVDDLLGPLAASFPAVPRAGLHSAATDGLLEVLSVEGIPGSETECARDYSLSCPEGWVDDGDGKTCRAPLGYMGPCSGAIHFEEDATPDAKRRRASACDAQFPCKGACTQDYGAVCPSGWTPEGAECVAPAGYTHPCVGRKAFGDFGWQEKRQWADQCGVQWPCRSPQGSFAHLKAVAPLSRVGACSADFIAECPQGWQTLGDSCAAPSTYTGPCSGLMRLGSLTAAQKRIYSEACQSPWPCAAALRR